VFNKGSEKTPHTSRTHPAFINGKYRTGLKINLINLNLKENIYFKLNILNYILCQIYKVCIY